MGIYEVQILDSYENATYADGGAGAFYGQAPPLVNASRGPGEWQSFDVIFNMVAGSDYTAMIKALTPGGRYLMANPRLSDMLRTVLTSKTSKKQAIFRFAAEKEQELLTLKEMIEDGRIHPVIDRVYPYQEAAAAHRRVETEQRAGIVVISMV